MLHICKYARGQNNTPNVKADQRWEPSCRSTVRNKRAQCGNRKSIVNYRHKQNAVISVVNLDVQLIWSLALTS